MIDVLRNIYTRSIALLNSYMEVEVTSVIPGTSAIHLDVLKADGENHNYSSSSTLRYWFLACEARLLDTRGNEYGEYLIHRCDADVTSVLLT